MSQQYEVWLYHKCREIFNFGGERSAVTHFETGRMVATKGKYGGLLVELGAGDPEATPTVGPTLRAVAAEDGFQDAPGNPKNLCEVFENSVKRFGDRPCLGRRIDGIGEFVFETYKVS
jgi:hypothetical protein